MLRKWASVIAAGSMLLSSTAVFAASDTEQSALTPGNTAGVQEAQGMDVDTTMALAAVAVVVAGVVLATTSSGNGGNTTSTTATGPL